MPFGCTVYGMQPREYQRRNVFSTAAKAIERGLENLRRATAEQEARRALAEIERAVIQTRRHLLRRRHQAEDKPPASQRRGRR